MKVSQHSIKRFYESFAVELLIENYEVTYLSLYE